MFADGVILAAACCAVAAAQASGPIFVSDRPDLFAFSTQGWGELGLGESAHAQGQALPMRIGDRNYLRGLGSHAPGEILIELDGVYTEFEAEVGLQWQDSEQGSVIFKVVVDGKEVFDSGVMRKHDPARKVSIPLKGADELRLVVTDARDGITCDCANWADARLVPDPAAKPAVPGRGVDVGQFARVMTWDPERMDGARNSRIEEFAADELFLGTEILPVSGLFTVPRYKGELGCIGLEWLERRRVRQLALAFEQTKAPPADGVRVEYWGIAKGGSTWQGRWKPLKGTLRVEGNRWVFDADWTGDPNRSSGALKVRWILPPPAAKARLTALAAYTDSRWDTTGITLQLEKPTPGTTAEIEMYNGEIVTSEGPAIRRAWDLSAPLTLNVRYTRPRPWKSDRTVIRIKLPGGAFGVAVDDLLANDCVYVRDYGFFAAREPAPTTLAAYKRRIARRKTILEQVREMPDQTLGQAVERVHRPAADLGPTLLSLACDNHKFIVHRTGTIEFDNSPDVVNCFEHAYPKPYACVLKPEFGLGEPDRVTRTIAEGWMPIHTITAYREDIVCQQRVFVAPYDRGPQPAGAPAWFNGKPLCVSDFTIENPTGKVAGVSLRLTMTADVGSGKLARADSSGKRIIFTKDDKPVAAIDTNAGGPLEGNAGDGCWTLAGTLPAGGRARVTVYIPGWDTTADEIGSIAGSDDLATATEAYWQSMLAPAMQVELPDALLSNVIRASQVHCLLAARNENAVNVAPWIGSINYGPLESEAHSVIRGMMFVGQTDFARRSLDYFIKRYNPQGFLTTGYTTMGTGWHLWTLGEFHALTRDKHWMSQNAAEVDRVCRWVIAQREKTMKLDARGDKPPEYGLMPPGLAADWDVFAYYAYLNGYYAAGLREAGSALADVRCPDADSIRYNAAELSDQILRVFRWTQSLAPVFRLRDGTWVPEYPTHVYCPWPVEDLYPGEDGGRSWCYDVEIGAHHLIPMGIMPPRCREADWMLDHMEDVQFLRDGLFYYPAEGNRKDWFNLGGFAKVQPYYARNAEAYAMRDDVKAFVRSYFNSLVTLLNREDLSLWEHFINGAFNKTHETGYFLYQTRTMLLTERGNELWLAPFVTSNWMRDGMVVAVSDAPTRFGPASYRISSRVGSGYIQAEIDSPKRNPPERIVVRLRHPDGKQIKSVTLNGAAHDGFDPAKDCVTIDAPKGKLVVRAMY